MYEQENRFIREILLDDLTVNGSYFVRLTGALILLGVTNLSTFFLQNRYLHTQSGRCLAVSHIHLEYEGYRGGSISMTGRREGDEGISPRCQLSLGCKI